MAPSPNAPAPEDSAFDLADFLPYQLSVAANLVSTRFARLYAARFGLTIHEWRVMAALGKSQPVTAGEIGGITAMDKVKVSRAMAGLQRRGLVTGHPDPADNRRLLLRFSDEGWAIYREIVPIAREFDRAVRAALRPGEAELLSAILARILASSAT